MVSTNAPGKPELMRLRVVKADTTMEKDPVLGRAFSHFNATVNIDGAFVSQYFDYLLLKSLLRNSTTSLRAASVASAL